MLATIESITVNAFSTAAIIGFIGFLLRETLARWLGEKVNERTQKRLSEFEAKLASEQAKVNDLRQFVISGKLKRHEALIERQVAAADDLWNALVSNKRHRLLVEMLKVLDIDKINELINLGNQSETIAFVSSSSGLDRILADAKEQDNKNAQEISKAAELSRPFISPLAWAYYSASNSISNHAVVTMIAWKNGVDTNKFLNNEKLVETVSRALPHQKKLIEDHGVGATYFLIEELEEKLLLELRRFVSEGETDQELIEQANQIVTAIKA